VGFGTALSSTFCCFGKDVRGFGTDSVLPLPVSFDGLLPPAGVCCFGKGVLGFGTESALPLPGISFDGLLPPPPGCCVGKGMLGKDVLGFGTVPLPGTSFDGLAPPPGLTQAPPTNDVPDGQQFGHAPTG
jgi:hypothetical protein